MTDEKPLKKPIDYEELFPGRFLKAVLFQGKSPTFTIKSVDLERFPTEDGKEQVRGVLAFVETEMQLKLNSTNGQCVKAMFGKKVAEWVGKRVTLCPEKDKFGAETVDAIRVAGSPDITENITVTVELPRRKPRQRTLTVTRRKGEATPQTQTKPTAASTNPEDFPRD